MRTYGRFISGLFLIAISGCVGLGNINPPEPSGPRVGPEDSQAVLNLTDARDREIASIRALYKVVISNGDGKSTFRQAIVLSRPDSLRMESLPLGTVFTLNLLAGSNGKYVWLDNERKRYFETDVPSKVMFSAFRLPLEPMELMSILVGRMPNLREGDLPRVFAAVDPGQRLVISTVGDQYYLVDAITGLVKRATLVDIYARKVVAEFNFTDFESQGDIAVPKQFSIVQTEAGLRYEFTLLSATLNVPVEPGVFRVSPPPGYAKDE